MTDAACLFCDPDNGQHTVVGGNATAYARLDNFPVADGHMEVVPRRHVVSLFDLTDGEIVDVFRLARVVAGDVLADGWTVGVNEGRAAGRTVDHVHLHLIPRRVGDVPDPRGGIRNVLPGISPDAWAGPASSPAEQAGKRR